MNRPLVSLLHRSGLFAYLRTQWRADDASTKESIKGIAGTLAKASVGALKAEFRELYATQQTQLNQHQAQISAAAADPRLEELAHEVRRLSQVLTFNAEHRERRHQDAFDSARICEQVNLTVEDACVHLDPAPHVIIDSLLPEDTYRAMLDAIPPEACFSQRDTRKQNFKPRRQGLAPEFTAQSWSFFEQHVVNVMLLPALRRLFEPYLSAAYADKYGPHAAAVAALPLRGTGGRLMLRRPGYHLDAHLDPRRVLVTCLVYFAQPGDNEEFGTQFFRIDGAPAIDRSNTYFPRVHGYTCELVRTVPFKPNTAIAFLNHGIAHGADIPLSAPAATRRYAYQCYIAPDPEAVAAIVGAAADDED